ncbi:threonyl-tRNA synthetase [Thermodesulfobium acidiphilum]|uniref:Threonine--tRNA ligase n=1 Tax=Thermodesulfobium acidiphilum TaxID=1794699 RepID=A0A2R4W0W3_THEAF|nr:threonine--tRNA ligase [Thermodesulfobium acidiphilum]AWB10447.1 threonyl-tRNA synthetase [Thermodesulfobium acidiphilum]PMP86078.1 MAG: threonine--tRNA ligase [Thermodesulfobium narugense]
MSQIICYLDNDKLVDYRDFEEGKPLKPITDKDKESLDVLRHSAAHLLAQAVKELFPETKLAIGPSIENGFYYDIYRKEPFTPEDLEIIEKKMKEISKRDLEITKICLKKEDVIRLFADLKEDYKLELINDIPDDEVCIYKQGNFVDLCRGPHLSSTGQIKHFKLLNVAGAYWRGDEKREMLQRIYGTAFWTEEELKNYLNWLEEVHKRDHRKLGKELDLYSMADEVGAGLILWHPNGGVIRTIIEDYLRKEHVKRGYEIVYTPHMMNLKIWKISGHFDFYKENMYIFENDGQEYAVKPMNCPGHMMIYNSKTRSYRDLPIRFFELGTVYRFERSGALHGLLRVRGFTQDDAHIFCTDEQLQDEIIGVLNFAKDMMELFGFKYVVSVGTRPDGSIGTDEQWNLATNSLISALKQKNIEFEIIEGDGAFYGPKIQVELIDALGRKWTGPTIQVDFALPERFNLEYADKDGTKKRPVMIHRTVVGSMERFLGALIENYAGMFPAWLSPIQIMIIPVKEDPELLEYSSQVRKRLSDEGYRAKIDKRNETLKYRIRDAELNRIPYILVIGKKEYEAKLVSLRTRGMNDEGQISIEEFIKRLSNEARIPSGN